jgi:hypothetical protein
MKFINGTNRNQLPFLPHRLMMPLRKTTKSDLLTFLDSLNSLILDSFSILSRTEDPLIILRLLKLFIYGYLNRMRSSRTLEKESPQH